MIIQGGSCYALLKGSPFFHIDMHCLVVHTESTTPIRSHVKTARRASFKYASMSKDYLLAVKGCLSNGRGSSLSVSQ